MYPTRVGWDPEFHYFAPYKGSFTELDRLWKRARDQHEAKHHPEPKRISELCGLGRVANVPLWSNLSTSVSEPPEDVRINPPLLAALHLLAALIGDLGEQAVFDELFGKRPATGPGH
jgi:hypothetical protein